MKIPYITPLSLRMPQQLNNYNYAFNNPVFYTDQQGLAVPALLQCAYYAYRLYKAAQAAKAATCGVAAGFSYIFCMKECTCGDKKDCINTDFDMIKRCRNKCSGQMIDDYVDCMKKNKKDPGFEYSSRGWGGSGVSGSW
jgi:hypothetical protein